MEKKLLNIVYFIALIAFATAGCKQVYEPAVIKANKNFLVVDGMINVGINAVTTIKLSRTRNVTDSSINSSPETGAQISIIGKSGNSYDLHEKGNGLYASDALTLSVNDEYALQVIAKGNTYQSDFVVAKATPSIDNLEWTYAGDGVSIFANTHDPQNKTRYYRWDFIETWQYHSIYEAELGLRNGLMFYIVDEPQNQRYNCWQTDSSSHILLGSSVNLTNDIISHDSITHIPQNDIKIEVRYSLLLRQYALDTTAYQYWQLLQKNTEQLGSLFDAQPSQLTGNIHNVKDTTEPVLGYISASTIEEKRLFISNSEVPGWDAIVYSGPLCSDLTIDQNADNYLIYNYQDTSYAPYYFSGTTGLRIAKKTCVDCTLGGGTNQKPSFW